MIWSTVLCRALLGARGRWVLMGAAAIVVGGSMAAAQERDAEEPTAFEADLLRYRSFFDYGGFEPAVESVLPAGAFSRWRWSAGATAEYSDNADQDASDRYGFRTSGTLGVGWLRRSPLLSAAADYSLGLPLYEEGAYDGDGSARHALAATLDWQPSSRVRLGGAGHATQNVEEGLSSSLSGVRSNYQNRSDEYGARASYEWRVSRDVRNDANYAFSYRTFVSEDAEGGDTLSHAAGTNVRWQATPHDGLSVGYAYRFEDDREVDEVRQNHSGSAAWNHSFLSFPGNRRSDLGVSYTADRGLFGGQGESDRDPAEETDSGNYWSHGVNVGYSWAPISRTEVSLNGGYQWILPDDGSDGGGWTYGGRLSRQFTERTTATVSYSESWEYTQTSSVTDSLDLTNVRRGDLFVESRLAPRIRGRAAAHYEQGDVDRDIALEGSEDYEDTGGDVSVSGALGPDGFWGIGYALARRVSDGEEDDYWLQFGDAFLRRQFLGWLEVRLSYRHERRDYDSGSESDDYDENRLTLGVTATR